MLSPKILISSFSHDFWQLSLTYKSTKGEKKGLEFRFTLLKLITIKLGLSNFKIKIKIALTLTIVFI
jgi:hypothetical protein